MESVSIEEYGSVVHQLDAAYQEIKRLRDRLNMAERFAIDMMISKHDMRRFGLDAPTCTSKHPDHNDVTCTRPEGHDEHHVNGSTRW